MNIQKALAVLAGGVTLTVGVNAQLVDFDILVSGDATSSTKPASLLVTDLGDDLRLTFEGTGLTSPETIKTLWLNLPAGVTFTQTGKSGSFDNPAISGPGSKNGFGGSAVFGWEVEFVTAGNPNDGLKRFGAGDSITFLVDGGSALNPADLLNFSNSSHGGLIGGIHVISVGANANGSAKVGLGYDEAVPILTVVPEPQTYALLFGAGVLGFAIVRRRLGRRR